jgi:ubiquinone/menaquinone biosynthesis C-methylase UbiE
MGEAPNLFTDGKAYERLMGRWSRLAGEKFLDWVDAPKNLKWLDAGCGNGAFTEVLIARCAPASVIGVDPSEGQLAYARGRPGAKGAEFRVADAQALPFPDNSFDAAAMALVIVFIPDPAKAARELARVVRPGGIAATYMWEFPNGFHLAPLAAAMKDLGHTPPERPNVEASTRDAMRDLDTSWIQRHRERSDPHSCQFFQLRRFLGLQHRAGRSVRQGAVGVDAERARIT